MASERTKNWLAAACAPLAIAAATLALPPRGEFPILDDWDYRDTVSICSWMDAFAFPTGRRCRC